MKKFVCVLIVILSLCVVVSAEDTLLFEDSCENALDNVTIMEGSVDGTKFYRCDGGVDLGYLPYETSSDFIYELDIRFNNEGCGFSFMKKGKWNSCIRIKDSNLALQTGGNSFSKLCEIDLDKWYHFTFLGRTNKDANSVTYGHIILEEYENGKRVNRRVFENVNLRNNAATHYINAFGGCDIDNLKAHAPSPTRLTLECDAESVVAGGSVTFTPSCFYNDLQMHGVNKEDISFELLDEEGYPLESDSVKIDINGLLTTEPLAPTQSVKVRAVSKSASLFAQKELKIVTGDIFTVTGVGVSEDGSMITQIAVRKNFAAYKDTVTFVAAFYNTDKSFKCTDFKSLSAKNLNEGENAVNVNIKVPEGFDVYKDKMNVYVITTLAGAGDALKVKKEELPLFDGAVSVICIKNESDISSVKAEDVLFFDVVYPEGGVVEVPFTGKAYVMGSADGLDTLFEIVE